MQGRDKIEQQSQEEGKAVLEYLAPELMPVLKIKAPPATVRHVVLPPREAKRLGQQWMFVRTNDHVCSNTRGCTRSVARFGVFLRPCAACGMMR